jgi:hypothetical protein
MKKIFFILVTSIVIFSCSKDDSPSVNLVGKWKTLSQEQYECTTAASNNTKQCGDFGFCVTVEFKADQTFQMTRTSDGSFVQGGTYSRSGNILSLTITGTQTQMYSLSLSGGTLITIYNYMGLDCKTKTVYQKL